MSEKMQGLLWLSDVLQSKQVETWIFEVSNYTLISHGSTAGELISVFREYGYIPQLWSEMKARLPQLSSGDVLPTNIIACSDTNLTEERSRSASTFLNS